MPAASRMASSARSSPRRPPLPSGPPLTPAPPVQGCSAAPLCRCAATHRRGFPPGASHGIWCRASRLPAFALRASAWSPLLGATSCASPPRLRRGAGASAGAARALVMGGLFATATPSLPRLARWGSRPPFTAARFPRPPGSATPPPARYAPSAALLGLPSAPAGLPKTQDDALLDPLGGAQLARRAAEKIAAVVLQSPRSRRG